MPIPVNATNIFSFQELKDLKALATTNLELKVLEAEKQALVDRIKQSMATHDVDCVELSGYVYTIANSQRRTVIKATKDEFISSLIDMGKKHLIATSIEPDLDSIFAEVDAGTLNRDYVECYVKVTPVTTLRCT